MRGAPKHSETHTLTPTTRLYARDSWNIIGTAIGHGIERCTAKHCCGVKAAMAGFFGGRGDDFGGHRGRDNDHFGNFGRSGASFGGNDGDFGFFGSSDGNNANGPFGMFMGGGMPSMFGDFFNGIFSEMFQSMGDWDIESEVGGKGIPIEITDLQAPVPAEESTAKSLRQSILCGTGDRPVLIPKEGLTARQRLLADSNVQSLEANQYAYFDPEEDLPMDKSTADRVSPSPNTTNTAQSHMIGPDSAATFSSFSSFSSTTMMGAQGGGFERKTTVRDAQGNIKTTVVTRKGNEETTEVSVEYPDGTQERHTQTVPLTSLSRTPLLSSLAPPPEHDSSDITGHSDHAIHERMRNFTKKWLGWLTG